MARALDAESYVFEGVWTNWSRGPLAGLTLTVNASRASILSPAIAILVSVAGVQLWRLFQFGLHQIRATLEPRPMIYHQLQITLRNTMTDMSTLWRLIRIAISWRDWKPVIGLATWTLIHFVLVIAFGLFSSWLLISSDEVLSRSPWCGSINQTYLRTVYSTNVSDPEHTRLVAEYNEYLYGRFATVRQHIDICDNSNTTCSVNSALRYPLPWTSSYVADACPFASDICHPDAGTVFLDTGLISSHEHLGLNAKSSDRVALRIQAKCAPLDDSKYTTVWQTVPAANGVVELADALYGRSTYNSRNATNTLFRQSYTCEQRYNMAPYSLTSYFATPGSSVKAGNGTFDPIPELRLTDADTSLMTLGYNDAYLEAVQDPWFSATQPIAASAEYCARSNRTLYVRDRPITALACTQQWQICEDTYNVSTDAKCSPPLGLSQLQSLLRSTQLNLNLNPTQMAAAVRMLAAGSKTSFFYLVLALSKSSSPPLKAQYYVNTVGTAISPPLPENQWQQEVEYWMNLILGYFQQNLLDYSTGQFVASTDYINATQGNSGKGDALQDAAFTVCQNQLIRSSSHRNFNFLALILIVVMCVVFTIVGLCLEDCVGCCRERKHRYSGPAGKGRQDMWNANCDLSMLRTIDELKHNTPWTLSSNGIPRSGPGYQISLQDLLTEDHEVDEGKGIVSPSVRRARKLPTRMAKDGLGGRNVSSQWLQHPLAKDSNLSSSELTNIDNNMSVMNTEAEQISPYESRLRRQPHFEFQNSVGGVARNQYNPVVEMEDWPWKSHYSRLRDDRGPSNMF